MSSASLSLTLDMRVVGVDAFVAEIDRLTDHLPAHPDDYEDWPIEVIDGVRWHVSPPDPEGVEGQQRVPCADQTDLEP